MKVRKFRLLKTIKIGPKMIKPNFKTVKAGDKYVTVLAEPSVFVELPPKDLVAETIDEAENLKDGKTLESIWEQNIDEWLKNGTIEDLNIKRKESSNEKIEEQLKEGVKSNEIN